MSAWGDVAYGVDMQGDRPLLVRATRSRGRLSFESCEPGDADASDRSGGRPALAAALAPRRSLTQWLEAPYASPAKARKVLPTLLDIQLPFALEDCIHEVLTLEKTGTGTSRALAVVARTTDVARRLHQLRGAGFDPSTLDHEGLALWTASLREAPCERDTPRVIIYFGQDRTTMVIGRGDAYMNTHGLRTPDASHIQRLLRSAIGGDMDSVQWYWVGPGAADETTVRPVREALTAAWPGEARTHEDPERFLARALAARALAAGPLGCNLRAGSFTHPRVAHRQGTRRRRPALVALAAGLILCAAAFGATSIANDRQDAAHARFREIAEAIAGPAVGDAKGEHALLIVQRHVDAEKQQMQPVVDAFGPSLTRTLARVLALGAERGFRFDALVLQGRRAVVSGVARDWDSCDALVTELEGRGYRVDLSREDAGADGWLSFSVKGERGDE